MVRSVLFAFLVCITSFAAAQNVGRISGTVLDDHGQIAEGANVCLSQSSGKGPTTINCATPTDHGQFQVPKIGFGAYHVFAIKESEGYSIENQSPGDQVIVSAATPSPDVTIRLQSGGAILSGIVQDKSDGRPVKGASVRYIDVDGNGEGTSSSHADGKFQLTVPSGLDLVIVVSAKGYKGWVYNDPSNSARPVMQLAGGERKQLDIEIEPKSPE
jgi:hypothetical protein